MATERESKFDIIQVAKIYLRAGIGAIIGIGSKLRYTAGPTFNNPLDIVSKGYVDGLFLSVIPEIDIIPIGSASPYTYGYSGQFGNRPSVVAVQDMGSGVYRSRPDITLDTDSVGGNVLAYGDFSADQIEIVIKP